jgi:hypothetical protein
MVELRVRECDEDILVYTLAGPSKAAEMIIFLADFMPGAQFLVQPLRH